MNLVSANGTGKRHRHEAKAPYWPFAPMSSFLLSTKLPHGPIIAPLNQCNSWIPRALCAWPDGESRKKCARKSKRANPVACSYRRKWISSAEVLSEVCSWLAINS